MKWQHLIDDLCNFDGFIIPFTESLILSVWHVCLLACSLFCLRAIHFVLHFIKNSFCRCCFKSFLWVFLAVSSLIVSIALNTLSLQAHIYYLLMWLSFGNVGSTCTKPKIVFLVSARSLDTFSIHFSNFRFLIGIQYSQKKKTELIATKPFELWLFCHCTKIGKRE